ncbi:MAG TPA: DUF3052 domain-containing protein [Bacteroidia bacterium]|nr:DUF3052 domain-containing protein [Bacteroidia bacterium]
MAGYSGTPLVKKLGIKEGFKIKLIDPPENYFNLTGLLPAGAVILKNKNDKADFIHLFTSKISDLEKNLKILKDEIKKDGMIWISWYKKSAGLPTEITEDIIRNTALPLGLVDVKVCAVDEKWSGLKLVWRVEYRK